MRVLPALALFLLLALPGCLSDAAAPADSSPPATTPVPAAAEERLADLAACDAVNVFAEIDAQTLRPHVPSNWTFTTGRATGRAILRMLFLECERESLLLMSTPMFTDDASKDKEANPDVVLYAFGTNATTVEAWKARGAMGSTATFTRPVSTGPLAAREVATENGSVVRVDLAPPAVAARAYEWLAIYGVGATGTSWAWAHEVSNVTATARGTVTLGPATALAGGNAGPQVGGLFWPAFQVTYRAGVPDKAHG